MQIHSLYRYPVKGLSPEGLRSVHVDAGDGFPLDRAYAFLRTGAAFDATAPAWLPKANFLMLMLHEQLARLQTRLIDDRGLLLVRTPDGEERTFALTEAAGSAAAERFFRDFLAEHLSSQPRLVRAPKHQFTDKAEKYVSLINLASVRELERRWGESLDYLRFRANVYIDGAQAFEELDWIGAELRLGTARMRVERRNGRCAATNVNPLTGTRDRDVPGRLRAEFGHKDLGIYLSVVQSGALNAGDRVEMLSRAERSRALAPTAAEVRGGDRLMCTACYYMFDPRALNAGWSRPEDLAQTWRCPDCGASKDACVAA